MCGYRYLPVSAAIRCNSHYLSYYNCDFQDIKGRASNRS
ncbi:conserved hypothetical protein [Vibrio crassostreae]|nr:conserved hypothetical protein [Vibrio crassostreae]CAK1823413.1 conserved hypothetical protein [Vibrio crassostreae]CAK2618755.1 conserved hypothetical protein [Vibrio crassostreae]CAK2641795.1 conserved hypothetical protein [Vibrio crassostreae]CAK2684947.1 conserved hypothetical protein [Vibrio crassostreae]